jgi:hypothetical protein
VAVLAAIGDVRLLMRGGISGAGRIARHLWRMCFALFIAAASIFLARQQLFPALLRKTGALVFLSVLPLVLMVFWLLRVRFTSAFQEKLTSGARSISSGDTGRSLAAAYMDGVNELQSSPTIKPVSI